jgi:hypothetical protein
MARRTRRTRRRIAALAAGITAIMGLGLVSGATGAAAYQPRQTDLYVAQNPGSCNKSPCVLYPKSAQLPGGRIVASFEDSEGPVVGQTLPLFKSDDEGTTWSRLAGIKAPAYLSGDPRYAAYTSNWTNPYFYVLPHSLGGLQEGTLLLADVVSGADTAPGGGDRQDVAIALYDSTDQGQSWNVLSIITQGTDQVHGPVWEPYLMMYQGKLVAYFSDEDETHFSGPGAADGGGQILAHVTSTDGVTWSEETPDVGTAFYSGRPGMTNMVPTTDGKWIMTFEYWGGGPNTRYKVCDDPLHCDPDSIGQGFPGAGGGSPVLVSLPDGRIVYNAAGSGSVWVNETGRSDGTWTQFQTPVAAGYSRDLQYVRETGRVLILRAPWGTGPVSYGETDLGHSEGAYYTLVNRKTGQVLAPQPGKIQDANLTGDAPDLVLLDRNNANDAQFWHLTPKGADVTLLNKAGGRSAGIWTGNATSGARLAQWVDDAGTDKQWTLVPGTDGYDKIRSVNNTSLYMTGATAGAAVDVEPPIDASANPSADDAQEWQLVRAPLPTDAPFSLKGGNSGRCLDVPNGRTGVQVQIYDCLGNQNQTITQTAAGELRVLGNCLGADGDGIAPGTRLILWACDGSMNQKWWFRLDGSVINRSNGLVIDVSGWRTANGSPVQLWTPLGNATQKWSRV